MNTKHNPGTRVAVSLALAALFTGCASAPKPTARTGPACPNWQATLVSAGFPQAAREAGIDSGNVIVEFTLTTSGAVQDPKIVRSSHAIFDSPTLASARKLVCSGGDRDVRVQFEANYKLQ